MKKISIQNDIIDSFCVWDGTQHIYRYKLLRTIDMNKPKICFIGLNPSTADISYDDNTVRRCINWSRRNKYGQMVMLNIFAYRSTNPKGLLTVQDPIGQWNNEWIKNECKDANTIVAAWGNWGKLHSRSLHVLELLKDKRIMCFSTTLQGQPKHPLYIPSDSPLIVYREPQIRG
jgi:hypothetical protein